MEITYPISSSRFLLALQVYARKMSQYETYEEVRKREFERISLFRPLPVVSEESIKTVEIEETPRYQLDITEEEKEEVVDLDSLFESLEDTYTSVSQISGVKETPSVSESLDKSVSSYEPLDLKADPFANLDLDRLGFGLTELEGIEDEDEGSEFELETNTSENPSDFASDKLYLNTRENTFDVSKAPYSSSQSVSESFETEPTRTEFKTDIFNLGYYGKREPWSYVAKPISSVVTPKSKGSVEPRVKPEVVPREREVTSPKNTSTVRVSPKVTPSNVNPRPSGVGSSTLHPQPTQVRSEVTDKTVRLLDEDFVAYCRRNLRVKEQVALSYFSPSEIESSVRQGKVLRKGGLLIFAHS